MWKDIKERFLNFETLKGMYLLPVGLTIIYLTIVSIEMVYKLTMFSAGFYCTFEGLRKIFVNRTKQAIADKQLIAERVISDKSA